MSLRPFSPSTFARARFQRWRGTGSLFGVLFLAGCRGNQEEARLAETKVAPASAVEAKVAQPPAGLPHKDIMVMSWGGKTLLGYRRVEHWVGQTIGKPPTEEFVVFASDGAIHRYPCFTVELPREFEATPGEWRAFIRPPEEIGSNRYEGKMLAVVSPAGVLRVYEFAYSTGVDAPDFQPSK